MVESARWHDDRLWLADRGAGEVLAIDLGGKAGIDRAAEVQARRSARVLVTDLPASG